jgi:hypothetical protein
LQVTFSGLAKVAIFTTNVDAENQTLINHKCVCVALNRHFCQTRVTGSCFFSVVLLSVHVAESLCVGLVALLQKLVLALGLCVFANVPPNALAVNQILSLLSFDVS